MIKICIATGTRAEYGLLKPLIDEIRCQEAWAVQLLVTGSHLSPEFGLTYKQIEKDGLCIDAKVEMLLSSDTAEGIVKSMGLGMIGFADAFRRLQPDLLIILGDRYEMLSLASAALIYKIPIAHLHGGEITEGAYDDAIRHAISKMSHLHFTSTEEYRRRVIQLGEQPELVFNVGAIGLDNIWNRPLLDKTELQTSLGISFKRYNYLVTFHPETLDDQPVEEQFKILLESIDKQEESFFIFTKANADTSGRVINELIDNYVAGHPDKAVGYFSMGQLRYLSTMKIATAVIGNSSSGIIEAPSFNIPIVNIGDRQKGRIQSEGVININMSSREVDQAFMLVKDETYLQRIKNYSNPYGTGGTSEKIVNHLKNVDLKMLTVKKFYSIECTL